MPVLHAGAVLVGGQGARDRYGFGSARVGGCRDRGEVDRERMLGALVQEAALCVAGSVPGRQGLQVGQCRGQALDEYGEVGTALPRAGDLLADEGL